MKYRIIFSCEKVLDTTHGWDTLEEVDRWEKESVVPRVDDSVFMTKVGWKKVSDISFSVVEKKRRIVYITVV